MMLHRVTNSNAPSLPPARPSPSPQPALRGTMEPAAIPTPAPIVARMQALIDSFPSLKRKGMTWKGHDANHFISQTRGLSDAEHHAAAFVLHVWNRYDWPPRFQFRLFTAVACWDDEHVAAARAWLADPWFA